MFSFSASLNLLNGFFEGIAAASSGGIKMSATFKIFPGKGIAIEITFTAKTPFPFFITVYDKANEFNTLDGLRKINKSFCIPCLDIIFQQVIF